MKKLKLTKEKEIEIDNYCHRIAKALNLYAKRNNIDTTWLACYKMAYEILASVYLDEKV